MRPLLALALLIAPAIAHADGSGSDDDDDDEVSSPDDAVRSPQSGSDEEGDAMQHGNGEASPETEDANEHAHHGHIHHEPGKELELVAPDARLRIGLAIE